MMSKKVKILTLQLNVSRFNNQFSFRYEGFLLITKTCHTSPIEFPPWLATPHYQTGDPDQREREREGERTEGGQERLARGQEDRRMPPTTPTITDKQQAASALPSSAAQTSSVYYQVTRTLVQFTQYTSSSSQSSLRMLLVLASILLNQKTIFMFRLFHWNSSSSRFHGMHTNKKKLLQMS